MREFLSMSIDDDNSLGVSEMRDAGCCHTHSISDSPATFMVSILNLISEQRKEG